MSRIAQLIYELLRPDWLQLTKHPKIPTEIINQSRWDGKTISISPGLE